MAESQVKLCCEAIEKSVSDRYRILKDGHANTVTLDTELAVTSCKQGVWDKAEEAQTEMLETSKHLLGSAHPTTIIRKGNLASTYWQRGRLKEAENLILEVLEESRGVLGVEHPDTRWLSKQISA